MNIYEAVEALIELQKKSISYLTDTISYKTEIAEILQKLLDSGGVGSEYMDKIIDCPDVKKLVETAWRKGYQRGNSRSLGEPYAEDEKAAQYMKTLEDKGD